MLTLCTVLTNQTVNLNVRYSYGNLSRSVRSFWSRASARIRSSTFAASTLRRRLTTTVPDRYRFCLEFYECVVKLGSVAVLIKLQTAITCGIRSA